MSVLSASLVVDALSVMVRRRFENFCNHLERVYFRNALLFYGLHCRKAFATPRTGCFYNSALTCVHMCICPHDGSQASSCLTCANFLQLSIQRSVANAIPWGENTITKVFDFYPLTVNLIILSWLMSSGGRYSFFIHYIHCIFSSRSCSFLFWSTLVITVDDVGRGNIGK